MNRMTIAAALVALVLASGCASTSRATSWQGRSVNELTMAWGPPDAMQQGSDGRQMLTYNHSRQVNGNTYQCRAWFIAEPNGRIIKADVNGNIGGCNGLLAGKPAAT